MELEDLIIQADEIKYETGEKENTAARVGNLMKDTLLYIKQEDDVLKGAMEIADNTLQQNITNLMQASEVADEDLQEQIDNLDALFLTVNQNIDGGVANSIYTSTPIINGQGA